MFIRPQKQRRTDESNPKCTIMDIPDDVIKYISEYMWSITDYIDFRESSARTQRLLPKKFPVSFEYLKMAYEHPDSSGRTPAYTSHEILYGMIVSDFVDDRIVEYLYRKPHRLLEYIAQYTPLELRDALSDPSLVLILNQALSEKDIGLVRAICSYISINRADPARVAQFATATSLQVLQGLDADIQLLADDLLANILFYERREKYTERYNIFQAIRPFLTKRSLKKAEIAGLFRRPRRPDSLRALIVDNLMEVFVRDEDTAKDWMLRACGHGNIELFIKLRPLVNNFDPYPYMEKSVRLPFFREEIAVYLINHERVDINHVNSASNRTLLSHVTDINALSVLLDHGASVEHPSTFHAFEYFLDKRNLRACQMMIDRGYPINTPNSLGYPALHSSLWTYPPASPDTLRWLIERGADVNARAGLYLKTPLIVALTLSVNLTVETIRVLLEAGADPSIADSEGRTPRDFLYGHKSTRDLILRLIVEHA